MKNIYLLLLAVLYCCTTGNLFAQSESLLTGTIADEKAQSVGFANVAVVNAGTAAVVTGAIADMDGNFKIKTPAKGTYYLKISALGYQQFQSPVFEISGTTASKDFGKLALTADAKVLQEVTIQAMRPTIVNEADKMVVSVEGTALASGSTAYEVLEKSPGVWVDQDGNLTLNGKGGVQILLNGKPSYLSGKDLQNLLQGMSAENLKDLEIITNPSAKYDAEGASGIININLKKNSQFGLNGGVYAGYSYNRYHGYTTGTNVNLKHGNWNTSINADLSSRPRYRDMDMTRDMNTTEGRMYMTQDGLERKESLSPSLRLATDYDLNDKHSIGMVANLQYADNYNNFFTNSLRTDRVTPNDTRILSETATDHIYKNGTFNLHYSGKLGTSTLSADVDYATIRNDVESDMFHSFRPADGSAPAEVKAYRNLNPTSYDIYSARTDYSRGMGKHGKMELGAKFSHVVSDNELGFYNMNDGIPAFDKARSSHFIFTENITAGYLNYSTKLNEKWSVQAGLRAEYTTAKGNSRTLNKIDDNDYLNLFPSVFVQQKVSDNYQLSYKYSRRINRPHYEHLNPFVFYIDPYTLATGNPHLKPQYTNSFEVTQMYKQLYHLVLGYAVTTDLIGEVPVFDKEKEMTIFERRNMDNFTNATATLVVPVRIKPGKWEINNNATLSYQHFTTSVKNVTETKEEMNFSAQSSHNILLPKNIRLELSAAYQGPGVYGLFEFDQMWWADAGLKRSFLDDKLAVSLSFTDIFKSRMMKINTVVDGNTNTIDQYFGQQTVRVHLRYNFNKGKAFETKKRNVNLDELNRTGS
ncbi:TonB-dependent receptor [Pontibacter sp. Tf4]|uniref:TonB-dependent receptor domain-containing protein n=1 Tax=Pontibacter sp. Tf4 TaxID=2761620 RepID=UPI0016283A7D|nr:TonB-dependent receptor [Pontibacter sp. Tf4]MBB6610669.1 TonB-dependent receptor [Pontibacter sp. Tf4]